MRIAVVCSDLGVRLPGTKGASLHVEAITRALAECGHDVLLVGVRGHAPLTGVNGLLLEHPGRSKGLRRELRKLRFTRRLARDADGPVAAFAPDVVYERLSLFGTAGSRLAERCGALHVVEVNALLAQEESQWRGLRLARTACRLERAVLDHADLRLPVSAELADEVDRVSPGRPTKVLANGVDVATFGEQVLAQPARRLLGLPPAAPVVAFAGTLRPWHGLDVAIRALPALPGVLLAVAGDGPVRAELELLAAREGVSDRVRWLGQLPQRQVRQLLAAADVAIAPYPPLAGFAYSPLKLYEYLAAGVPIVASDIGQISAVLGRGRWGRLVPPGDPAALAAALRAVIDDPAGSRATAQMARQMALREHSWQARAKQVTEMIEARWDDRALAG